jgi:putative zinc finger protein
MPERTHIPTSPACGQWETLLVDALDGLLRPEDEATFSTHMAGCASCTTLFEEARQGREWLEFLSPEPDVPAGLLDKLLAQTGPGQMAGMGLATPAGNVVPVVLVAQRRSLMARLRRFAEPRLLMTAAMAFFSIAVTLNLTGVRLSHLHLSDLKPTSLKMYVQRQFTTASTPIIRYYDHLRFVYEVQSRMRELRRTTQNSSTPDQNPKKPAGPGESQQNPNHKDGGSRVDPPQQSGAPTIVNDSADYLETSLSHEQIQRYRNHGETGFAARPAHSSGWTPQRPGAVAGDRGSAARRRSTVWIA